MRKSLLFSIFTIISLAISAQENLQLTLNECIRYAEEHNLTLKNGELNVSAAEIQLKQSRLQMTPTVSAGASQNFGYSHGSGNFNIGGNYSLNAGVNIFNGLNTYNSIKQSQLHLTQAQLQVEQARNQIRIQIIRSYLTILMNLEMVDYQQNVLETSRQQVADGAQKFKVGQILESDFLMLQSQYLADSINTENIRIAIDNEYVTLRDLLRVPANQHLSVAIPDSASLMQSLGVPALDEVMRQAFDYLPDLKMQENSVKIAEYDVKIAKSAYYPTLSASASISTGYNAAYGKNVSGITNGLYDNLGESIGLNLSIPIYKQGSVRNNVRMKNIALQQAELSKESTEIELVKEIESYHLDLKKAYNNYTLSERQAEAYHANYLAYNQKFIYGAITAVDLLQQQTNYLNILNNYMQNKYSFLMERKILDVYTGKSVEL